MRIRLVSLVLIICSVGYAQTLVRQDSNYQLKKVVYSGDASQFPQITNSLGSYAVIPIPEINPTNMPSVTAWVYPTANFVQPAFGWMPSDYSGSRNVNVVLTNGICYLGWYSGGGFFSNFVITVVYEYVPTNSTPQQLPPVGQMQATLTNSENNGASVNLVNLNFTTQTNNFYYVQASTNLTSWINLDGPFLGNGNLFLKAYPTTNQDRLFFRFSQTPLESW
jgi:hypothetical protein